MDINRYRVKIVLEKVGGGTHDFIGERWIELNENISSDLSPLPDDREIFESMADKHPGAWMEHEKIKKQINDRREAVKIVSRRVFDQLNYLIESQDKVNGY